jgi:hypothetical protein
LSRSLCGSLWLLVLLSCTTVRVREHTRESYIAPPERGIEDSRLIEAPRTRVFQSALAELQRWDFAVAEASEETGRIVASRRLRRGDESRRFAALGEIEKAVTQTTRRYRSFDPRHLRCESCIVREGRLVESQTALLERSSHPIDIDLEAHAVVTLQALAEGSRIRVALDLNPAGRFDSLDWFEPRSSGVFERGFLDAVEASSSRSGLP